MHEAALEWTEDDLRALVANGTKESLTLDYKQCDALAKTDGKKNEVSKDVSALANSAGGAIVYGVVENGHVPVSLDSGFDRSDITKEWLEQVINSRVQRRIDGVRVNQVELAKTNPGRVAYVVYVPQSTRAPHQASDKKFYKRFNFESVPMEEYEVRDVARRSEAPDLQLAFRLTPPDPAWGLSGHDVMVDVTNLAATPAAYAVISVLIDSKVRVAVFDSEAVASGFAPTTATAEGRQWACASYRVLWGSGRLRFRCFRASRFRW